MVDTVADQFHNFHKSLLDMMSKLLKNKDCKDRMLSWLRLAVGLNQSKEKMFTSEPVASDGFVLGLIDLMLLFCKPFASKFGEYHLQFPKVNCFYLISDKYLLNA
jgi:hypothetical protein